MPLNGYFPQSLRLGCGWQVGDRVDRGDVEPDHGLRSGVAGLRPLVSADSELRCMGRWSANIVGTVSSSSASR